MPTKTRIEDAESSPGAPPVKIPSNAKITAQWQGGIDPGGSQYPDDLRGLAAEEFPNIKEPPTDPLTEFCAEWSQYAGHTLRVTRLPDPAGRRIPGQGYNRLCLDIESLGDAPFDPTNLQGTLQLINGNSGGAFRLWLIDEYGQTIEGAFLSRVVIGDPPRSYNPPAQPQQQTQQVQQQKNPPSEFELTMQDLQKQLLMNALKRVMEPPPPPPPVAINSDPRAGLSEEDRLTLFLTKEGALLPGIVQRLTTLAAAPENATAEKTWKDRLIDAGFGYLEQNPNIVPELLSRVERIAARFKPTPQERAFINPLPQPGQPQQQQQQVIYETIPHYEAQRAQPVPTMPDADPEDEEEIEMTIIEDIISYLNSAEPITLRNPIFKQLAEDYPLRFRAALYQITTQDIDIIIQFISSKSPLYRSLLTSPASGPYLRQRLEELQRVCQAEHNKTATGAPQNASTEANIEETAQETEFETDTAQA